MFLPGSAVRLPYHQPEKKDLSVFLARTELKQQKFVGASRMSWKQFIPPASSLSKVDGSLPTADAISLQKVGPGLPAMDSPASVVDRVAKQCLLDLDELPDLLSVCSKSKTISADISPSCSEVTDTQAQTSLNSLPRKLLLLSPLKNTPAASELSTLLDSNEPKHTEQVETTLVPAVGKKLILDPADKEISEPIIADAAASEAGDVDSQVSPVLDCMATDQQDGDDLVAKIPPSTAAAAKISSRSSRRALPSNVPLPQLSGNPNDIIELDDDGSDDGKSRQVNASDEGVERLMERVLRHARVSAQTRKPKTVEVRSVVNSEHCKLPNGKHACSNSKNV